MMSPDHVDKPLIERAVPVSPTVLRLSRPQQSVTETVAYVDVRRGVQVPPPANEPPVGGARQVISWDPGPVLMVMDAAGQSTQLVDLRTGLRGPATPFDWGNPDFPILAIPGEPVRRFWRNFVPLLVEHRAANGDQVMQNFSDVFPELLSLGGVDAVTLMYGDFSQRSVARATAHLDDRALQAVGAAAAAIGAGGPDILAMLFVLTGADPAAFHPDGHFGIAHMSEFQLVIGGWAMPPETILRAGAVAQVETMARTLTTMPSTVRDSAEKVLAFLATGTAFENGDDATVVVAAPVPDRLKDLAPRSPDGSPATQITMGDLRILLSGVLEGPVGQEIFARMWGFSFV